jgi:hypothetical protein
VPPTVTPPCLGLLPEVSLRPIQIHYVRLVRFVIFLFCRAGEATHLRDLQFCSRLSKVALEKLIALFLVTFRPRFQERLTNLCHATTFSRSNSFKGFLQIRPNSE